MCSSLFEIVDCKLDFIKYITLAQLEILITTIKKFITCFFVLVSSWLTSYQFLKMPRYKHRRSVKGFIGSRVPYDQPSSVITPEPCNNEFRVDDTSGNVVNRMDVVSEDDVPPAVLASMMSYSTEVACVRSPNLSLKL
jgi:hypothetical protein